MDIIVDNISEYTLSELNSNKYIDVSILDFSYLKDENSNKYYKSYKIRVYRGSPQIYLGDKHDYYNIAGKIQLVQNNKIKITADYTLKNNVVEFLKEEVHPLCNCESKIKYILRNNKNLEVYSVCPVCMNLNSETTKELKELKKIENQVQTVLDNNKPQINKYPLIEYVAQLCYSVEKYGFVSYKDNPEENTCDDSWNNLIMKIKMDNKYYQTAEKLIDTLKNMDLKTEFIMTLKLLVKKGFVGYRERKIASLIYKVCTEYIVNSNSNWVGNIGDKLELPVRLTSVKQACGDYGSYNIYTFDYNGNQLFTFSSKIYDISEGKNYKITLEVVKHENYNNKKTTKIKLKGVAYVL